MPHETDERLKSYLDTNQLRRERLCRAVLANDRRFSDVRPRHPRGGPDGGRDIEAIYLDEQLAFGAVGFLNQATDSSEDRRRASEKFSEDLSRAVSATGDLDAFVFFTNVNLTIGQKEALVREAREAGLRYCDIFDRERLRIALDDTDGLSIRFQYLDIPLSEAEQAGFFARWGDKIQAVVSTGFDRMEARLNRVLFLQETRNPIDYVAVSVQLDRVYPAEEIGHFRLFCYLSLIEEKLGICGLLFGASDLSQRMRTGVEPREEEPGIRNGISSGQWELRAVAGEGELTSEDAEEFSQAASGSSVGMEEVEFLTISYGKRSIFRPTSVLTLGDLDDSRFFLDCNRSLAERISAVHVYSNGYKLAEVHRVTFDESEYERGIPVEFSDAELEDPWVRVWTGPYGGPFHLRFFDVTPRRLSTPRAVTDSLEG